MDGGMIQYRSVHATVHVHTVASINIVCLQLIAGDAVLAVASIGCGCEPYVIVTVLLPRAVFAHRVAVVKVCTEGLLIDPVKAL